jgi:hypothetical protein
MEVPKLTDNSEGQAALPGMMPAEPKQATLPGFPSPAISETRYRAFGKQVLQGAKHIADAVDENTAKCVADAMNAADEQEEWALMLARGFKAD